MKTSSVLAVMLVCLSLGIFIGIGSAVVNVRHDSDTTTPAVAEAVKPVTYKGSDGKIITTSDFTVYEN